MLFLYMYILLGTAMNQQIFNKRQNNGIGNNPKHN